MYPLPVRTLAAVSRLRVRPVFLLFSLLFRSVVAPCCLDTSLLVAALAQAPLVRKLRKLRVRKNLCLLSSKLGSGARLPQSTLQ